MASRRAIVLLASLFASSIALQVTPDSPCAPLCADGEDDDTKGEDITCNDSEYLSSPAGQKFQRCMTCLQDSEYSKGRETDQQWFLYNMRYSFDYCVLGYPNATDVGSSPCQTSTACGALQSALLYGELNPDFERPYSYCNGDDGSSFVSDDYTKCLSCVRAGKDHTILTNYLIALEAGCTQQPPAGQTVSLNDTVFAETLIEKVDPVAIKSDEDKMGLPTTTIAAIAISGLVAVLLAIGCIYMQYRKCTNKRNPRRRGRARRAVSSMSFRCRAPPTAGGAFVNMDDEHHYPQHDDGQNEKAVRFETVQDEYDYDEKRELQLREEQEAQRRRDEQGEQRRREEQVKQAQRERPFKHPSEALSSNPIRLATAASSAPSSHHHHNPQHHSPTSARPNLWNPHNAIQSLEGLARSPSTSSRGSFSQRAAAGGNNKESLAALRTQHLPSAPPPVQQSPMARFSPQSEWERTPTSAQSSAPLLPIKPYNPADHGTSSPSLGPVGMGSPASASERRYAPASPALSNGSPMMNQGGWPLPAHAVVRPGGYGAGQSPVVERGQFGGFVRR